MKKNNIIRDEKNLKKIKKPKMQNHITPTPEAGKQFYQSFHDKGKIVMLNLIKYKVTADYTGLDSIKPAQSLSGKEAYKLYMNHTLPALEKAGGRLLFFGKSNAFLIGPESETWDAVLLVEHQSVEQFMAFAQDADYLKTMGHRTAALEDSRLLPISQLGK